MSEHAWIEEFPGAITVCDTGGTIVAMNRKAAEVFSKDGGATLVGTDVRACHPERARAKLEQLLQTQSSNVYTIRKGAVRKMVYQSPWYRDGVFAGIVELSFEIPGEMPEFVRG